MTAPPPNVDEGEVERFAALAGRWWDTEGELATLHAMNPVRLAYVDECVGLAGKTVLDVGCGGGILAEAMAERGARVTGIDAGEEALAVAQSHQRDAAVKVAYRKATAESLAEEQPGMYDVVTCMELLEHVPSPSTLIAACARLTRPGGAAFFSTLNRNPKSYALAVLGAEYVLRLLPRGTHDYARFLRPSEVDAWARQAGLGLRGLTGVVYNPLLRRCRLSRDIDVNYIAWFGAPEH